MMKRSRRRTPSSELIINKKIGDVWSSFQNNSINDDLLEDDASIAFENGTMNSCSDDDYKKEKEKEDWSSTTSLRVAFRNKSRHTLILSWIDPNGKCHHFYTLNPAKVLEGPVTSLDHTENTFLGDSFCIAYIKDTKKRQQICDNKIIDDPKYIIGGYRPRLLPTMATCEKDKERNGKNKNVHLVTISQEEVNEDNDDDDDHDDHVCCFVPSPVVKFLRRGSNNDNNKLQWQQQKKKNGMVVDDKRNNNDGDDDKRMVWIVNAEESIIDDENQIDTSDKVYIKQILGGWPVYVEPTLFDDDDDGGDNGQLKQKISDDLEWASKRLPSHARMFLKENCPVWINRSLCWGPKICPIKGRGLCFHPGSDFLQENLMNKEKACCVEMYNAKEYYESDSSFWGKGGVFIHEFAHAYHYHLLDNGYKNCEIIDCYNKSVNEDRLYDWVKVHGPQGPMNKAYACENAMEYFAELSSAFLGQPDLTSEEKFNKWYPFNRRHVKEHDPRAYQLLKKLWKISSDNENEEDNNDR